MPLKDYVFTSESVSEGHPDKLCDQVSDAVLDALLERDPDSRVACESLAKTGMVIVAGEITTRAQVNYAELVRHTIREIGYTSSNVGFDADTCAVILALDRQSLDIARGVDEATHKEQGAGDQGLMFGFACDETPELMPLPIVLAHHVMRRLTDIRKSGDYPVLRPDAKSQVTVEYRDGRPYRVDTVVVSSQHSPEVRQDTLRDLIVEEVIKQVVPAEYVQGGITYHVNPTGRFVIGGPVGDCGLTGRKIIVDTYGGYSRHGGGAFSGKDPSKVDRSAAYMARYIAKNIVAAGLANKCEVQLSYAIGVAEPTSVLVDAFDTGVVSNERLSTLVREHFELKPAGIIRALDLKRPIYRQTAAYGHFGRTPEAGSFTWERTDRAAVLRQMGDGALRSAGRTAGQPAARTGT